MQRQASFNELFNASFEEIAANRAACLIFLAVTVPLGAVSLAVFETAIIGPASLLSGTAQGLGGWAASIAGTLLELVAQFWLTMALLRRTLRVAFDRLPPFIGTSVLNIIGLSLGILLFVIPGLIFATRFVLVPALVTEGRIPAMDSFAESWERTRESGWALFGLVVCYLVVVVIVTLLAGAFAESLPESLRIAGWLVESLASQGGTILSTAVIIGAYRLLGDNTREIEEVFA